MFCEKKTLLYTQYIYVSLTVNATENDDTSSQLDKVIPKYALLCFPMTIFSEVAAQGKHYLWHLMWFPDQKLLKKSIFKTDINKLQIICKAASEEPYNLGYLQNN